MKLICLALFASLLLCPGRAGYSLEDGLVYSLLSETPNVTQVYDSGLGDYVSILSGSIFGGTRIYITGQGFSPDGYPETIVKINGVECETIPFLSSSTKLVCDVPYGDYSAYVVDFVGLEVSVGGTAAFCCYWYSCSYLFSIVQTPVLHTISPAYVYPNDVFDLYVLPVADKISDLMDLKIAGYNIVIPDDESDEDEISSNWFSILQFAINEEIPTGAHELEFRGGPGSGYADELRNSEFYDAQGNSFNIKVHPRIDSISSNTGFQEGSIITITGQGFTVKEDTFTDEAEVFVAGSIPCSIVSRTNSEIQCEVQRDERSSIPTTYIGHSGLNKYYFSSLEDYPDGWDSRNISLSGEDPWIPESTTIRVAGLFLATETGDYTFMITGDDKAYFRIDSEPFDESSEMPEADSLDDLVSVPVYTPQYYDKLFRTPSEQWGTISLEAGEYYPVEIYAYNKANDGYFKVGYQGPEQEEELPNYVPNTVKVSIVAQNTYEKLQIKVYGADGGTWKMKLNYYEGARLVYSATSSKLDFDASEGDVMNAFRVDFDAVCEVSRSYLDSSGNDISSGSGSYSSAMGYKYTITFTEHREYDSIPTIDKSSLTSSVSGVSPASSIVRTQSRSTPISGTFRLRIDGTYTDWMSYDVNQGDLWNEVARLTRLVPGTTQFSTEGSPLSGYAFYMRLFGSSSIPSIVGDASRLTGGLSGVSIVVNQFQAMNLNRPEFLVIPSDVLFTTHDVPQVTVKVGGILGGCPAFNCDYEIIPDDESPTVSSASFVDSSGQLDVTISTDAFADWSSASTNEMSLTFGGTECDSFSLSSSSISCTFSTNSEGVTDIVAGEHKPRLFLEGYGYFPVSASSISISPTISSVSPSTGSVAGGTRLTITGTHFGSDPSVVTVLIGDDSYCEVISASSTELECITGSEPTNGSTDLTLEINGVSETSSSAFTHQDGPTITEMSSSSISPVLKTDFTLTGTSFGTDTDAVEVYLINTEDEDLYYELAVLSVEDTSVDVRFAGGAVGTYYFRVYVDGDGYSTNNAGELTLEITVDSVSPTSGSHAGGTVLRITGTNFSPISNQNQVLIGDSIYCSVLESTSTEIVCQMSSNSVGFEDDTALDLVVWGRLAEPSTCTGTCNFSFKETKTPEITSISASSGNCGDTLTLRGTLLADSNADSEYETEIYIGDYLVETIISQSSTAISVEVPGMTFESDLQISVYISNIGYASIDSSLTWTTNLSITDVSPISMSVGGAIITVTGSGFHSSFRVALASGNCYHISATYTQIKCRVDEHNAGDGVRVYLTDYYGETLVTSSFTARFVGGSSPTVSSVSGTAPDPSSFTLTYKGTNLGLSTGRGVLETLDYSERFVSADASLSSSSYVAKFTDVPFGSYRVLYEVDGKGYGNSGTTLDVGGDAEDFSGSASSPYSGGVELVLSGNGFDEGVEVKVCGFVCEIQSVEFTSYTCLTPQLVLEKSQEEWSLVDEDQVLEPESYSTAVDYEFNLTNTADGSASTYYYTDTEGDCFIQYDFGEEKQAAVERIRYLPQQFGDPRSIIGDEIQTSNDGETWTTVHTIPNTTYSGWNDWYPDEVLRARYWKWVGGSESVCEIAEWEVRGVLEGTEDDSSLDSIGCDVEIISRDKSVVLTDAVTYESGITAILLSVSPSMGTTAGGTEITLTGENFETSSTPTVLIDDVECEDVVVEDDTTITCTTGYREEYVASSISIIQATQGYVATNGVVFLYIDRWSESNTWGGESPPRYGDSVWIPSGQNVLYDESSPYVYAMIIEGSLVFDRADLTLDASYIMILNGGSLTIGTEDEPFEESAVITMHGTRDDIELPAYGVKVIGCREGTIDMHGKVRTPTWTKLDEDAPAGSTSITLMEEVDWVAGETIVIATSTISPFETEERVIASVSEDLLTITFEEELEFDHWAHVETFNGVEVDMRAEVGLLSRNIVVQGDDNSETEEFGVHIMLYSEGDESLKGRFSYVEVRQAGQAFLLGRYPIHFHMIGTVYGSYVIGCAIHHTYNRAVTIHGVYFFTVKYNVAYLNYGHAFFIEDGAERGNRVVGNLGLVTLRSMSLLNTDTSPSTFWITHPNNDLEFNHAAGSEHYGFWYDLREHPGGPSASESICPRGEQMGLFRNNVAHSNTRYGLRIYSWYIPREDPCDEDASFDDNPLITATFENFLAYRNGRNGAIAEMIGDIRWVNFTIIDSGYAGMEVSTGNFTHDSARITDSLVVGRSSHSITEMTISTVGIWGPTAEGLLVENVAFVNFEDDLTALSTCSHCKGVLIDSAMGSMFVSGLSFTDVVYRVKWPSPPYMDYIQDIDGSLTDISGGGWAMPYYKYALVDECSESETHDGIICDSTIQIRRVVISEPAPGATIKGTQARIANVEMGESVSGRDLEDFDTVDYLSAYATIENGWGFVLPTSYTYNIHFGSGFDFTEFTFDTTDFYLETDLPVFLQFNFTDPREFYYTKLIDGVKNTTSENGTALTDYPSTDSGALGDHFLDSENGVWIAQIDGRRGLYRFQAEVYSCLEDCTTDVEEEEEPEEFVRYWSNGSMWPGAHVPVDGDSVEIPSSWTVYLDVSTAQLQYLEIRGVLIFDDTKNYLKLCSKAIFIRGGQLLAGSEFSPFPGEIDIEIIGTKNADYLDLISSVTVGNKAIVNSGSLYLYGKYPLVLKTRLKSMAREGNSTISVVDSVVDWPIGALIAIGPTGRDPSESELFEITGYTTTGLRLNGTIVFTHYGAKNPDFTSDTFTLDTRAEVVLLSRKIRIYGGDDEGWGARILTAKYRDESTNKDMDGSMILDGVEIKNCGQYDTEQAAFNWEWTEGLVNEVSNSAIHSSNGLWVNLFFADGISFHDNVFYGAVKYGIKINKGNTNLSFKDNIMLHVIADDETSTTAIGFYWNNGDIPSTTGSEIKGNIVADVVSYGFYLKADDCDMESERKTLIQWNVAHSTEIGFYLPSNGINGGCAIALKFIAYMCSVDGVLMASTGVEGRAEFIVGQSNANTLTVNLADEDESSEIEISVKNSVFIGVRSTEETNCQEVHGPRISIATQTPTSSGKTLYGASSFGLSGVTMLIYDNQFLNFEWAVDDSCESTISAIQQNDEAPDSQAFVRVFGNTYENVPRNGFIRFRQPSSTWIGESECVSMICTGMYNVLVQVEDTVVDGIQFSGLNANPYTITGKRNLGCELVNAWQGYICPKEDYFVNLFFESLDSDRDSRIFAPITISNSSISYSNTLNQMKDHSTGTYYGSNEFLARFQVALPLSYTYTITSTGTYPSKSLYFLRGGFKEAGSILLEIKFDKAGSVSTLVDGEEQDAVILLEGKTAENVLRDDYADVCGAYIYNKNSKTLSFVVTNDADCIVEVVKESSVSVNSRFDMSVDEFYSNGGVATAVDAIASYLGISLENLKVVSVRKGSAILDIYIQSNSKDSSSTKSYFKEILASLEEGITSGDLSFGAFDLLDFEANFVLSDNSGDTDYSMELGITANDDGSFTVTKTSYDSSKASSTSSSSDGNSVFSSSEDQEVGSSSEEGTEIEKNSDSDANDITSDFSSDFVYFSDEIEEIEEEEADPMSASEMNVALVASLVVIAFLFIICCGASITLYAFRQVKKGRKNMREFIKNEIPIQAKEGFGNDLVHGMNDRNHEIPASFEELNNLANKSEENFSERQSQTKLDLKSSDSLNDEQNLQIHQGSATHGRTVEHSKGVRSLRESQEHFVAPRPISRERADFSERGLSLRAPSVEERMVENTEKEQGNPDPRSERGEQEEEMEVDSPRPQQGQEPPEDMENVVQIRNNFVNVGEDPEEDQD